MLRRNPRFTPLISYSVGDMMLQRCVDVYMFTVLYICSIMLDTYSAVISPLGKNKLETMGWAKEKLVKQYRCCLVNIIQRCPFTQLRSAGPVGPAPFYRKLCLVLAERVAPGRSRSVRRRDQGKEDCFCINMNTTCLDTGAMSTRVLGGNIEASVIRSQPGSR